MESPCIMASNALFASSRDVDIFKQRVMRGHLPGLGHTSLWGESSRLMTCDVRSINSFAACAKFVYVGCTMTNHPSLRLLQLLRAVARIQMLLSRSHAKMLV